MENSVRKISKALLDLATVSDAVLHTTTKGQSALGNSTLDSAQRSLLGRIDGFRSIDQVLAMSGDLFAVHAALGKMMASGLITTDFKVGELAHEAAVEPTRAAAAAAPIASRANAPATVAKPAPSVAPSTSRMPAPVATPKAVVAAPTVVARSIVTVTPDSDLGPLSELENAKLLLLQEAKLALGKGAEKLRVRIDACQSIEEIFDLIVKVQEHLTATGKGDPAIFLDRLTTGLAAARKKTQPGKKAP